jgi:phosphoglycerol transferase
MSAGLAVLLILGVADQTREQYPFPSDAARSGFTSDRAFVRTVEASVPNRAMILQLPYIPFPESPPHNAMLDYDHFRGYLHSTRLRWSYGAMRGREGDQWQEELASMPIPRLVETAALAGFEGIYVDRNGYKDEEGPMLEEELFHLLKTTPLVSENGRLVFFNLGTYAEGLRAGMPLADWEAKRAQAIHPVYLKWRGGFSTLESSGNENWRWCSSQGELVVTNSGAARRVKIEMRVGTSHQEMAELRITADLFTATLNMNSGATPFSRELVLPPGDQVIYFSCNAKKANTSTDPRDLVFRILDFRLNELPE